MITDNEKLKKLAELLDVEIPGCDYDDLDEQYDEMLNECSKCPESIMGVYIEPAKFLQENDPTAYRCGKVDWLDSELQDNKLFPIGDKYLTEDEVQELKDDIISEIEDL